MRGIGSLHPTEGVELPADTVTTLLIAGSSGQAVDYPTDAAGGIARFTAVSTVGAQLNFVLNLQSTKAAAPSSGTSTLGTTGFGHLVLGTGTFQIPSSSTGWSVAALSSGYVMAEFWKRA